MKKSINLFKKLTHRQAYAGAFVLLFSIQAAHAQTDSVKKLKEVQINSKTPLKKQDLIPVQEVSSNDFNRYDALNVADAVTTFAGVNLKDYGGIGGLKTISVRSLSANHTIVLYDGIALDDAQSGQIDLGRINLYNVQDIALYNGQLSEIVQTARAYSGASALVINTLNPNLSAAKPYQLAIGAEGGSFGLIVPHFQWQQRLSKNWSFALNGIYTGANGQYKYKVEGDGSDTLAIRKNSAVKTFQTDGGLYWAKNDSNKFSLQFNYNNNDQGLPGPVIFYNPNSNQHLQKHDLFVQSVYDHKAANSFRLLVSSKYQQNYLHYTDPDFLNNTGGLNEHYTQHEFYQSVAVGYHLLPGWEVSYSSDAMVNNLFSDVYRYAFPTRLTLLNALATDVTAGKWHFQGNVLHTFIHESVKTGKAGDARSVFSPTIAASFKPADQLGFLFRAFYKDIFRTPTFSEQYYYATVPRDIRPERVKEYDLGITYAKSYNGLLHDVALTADAYYNDVHDKIIYVPTRSPATPSVTNLGKVDIRGVDITAKSRWQFSPKWQGVLSASYTYQNAVDVTDAADSYYLDQIPYTPKNLVNVNAGVEHGPVGLYYNQAISSSRYYSSNNDPAYYLPGYGTGDASLVYHFKLNKYPVVASAEVNNLFNKGYVIVRSYPMPGRSIRLSFQITI